MSLSPAAGVRARESEALENISKKLLNRIQVALPLTPAPFEALGEEMGISGREVICRLTEMKEQGTIRQISPVIDARRLGYRSTLVAMSVDCARMEHAAHVLAEHPGVSHAYERDHAFNLWFTLAVPPSVDADDEAKRMGRSIGAAAVLALPAVKLFKIRAHFALDEELPSACTGIQAGGALPQEAALNDLDRLVINELQQDLPLVPAPFDGMAEEVGMTVPGFLSRCQSLLERGIIRRYSASVNHRRVGYTANAMTCWAVPPDMVDAIGQKLASLAEVSHCYERKTSALWPYNLFAMIHAHAKDTCQDIADRISAETGLRDRISLFSTREFKKTRIKYLV